MRPRFVAEEVAPRSYELVLTGGLLSTSAACHTLVRAAPVPGP
ncbi:MAG: hypothetical protein SFX73_12350 [Kofleriaceae bacterium]|nr:hypothetical protein [Kofleriaceae bacterium]